MDKIKVLDKSTSELIAAGEVVERPASIVKELIENSIDAKATKISVEIKDGGISFIKISDNGVGMSENDVKTAFLRHATSKIKTSQDLYKIKTLGFRGEALCAIAIVSKIEVFTKETDKDLGYKLKINASKIEASEQMGCPIGTTIIVRDVFFNTPARRLFLKKESTEAAYIYDIIEKLALSHSDISFRLINNGKETFYSVGNGNLLELIASLYGKAYSENALAVKYENEGVLVRGFTLKPEISKQNRQMQIYFINGRYIKNSVVTRALESAYKNSIMVHKFPIAFLYIEIDPSFVDVNVHPTKLEVKFKNENNIYNAVYFAVKDALDKSDGHFTFKTPEKVDKKPSVFELYEQVQADAKTNIAQKKNDLSVDNNNLSLENVSSPLNNNISYENSYPLNNEFLKNDNISFSAPNAFKYKEPKTVWQSGNEKAKITPQNVPTNWKIETSKEPINEKPNDEILPQQTEILNADIDYKIIGEIFDSFIILEATDCMLLVDKHAAHERLIYEDLLKDNSIFRQMLLSPITVTLSKTSCDIVAENKVALEEYGFTLDSFGETDVIIRTVPSILAEQNIEDTLEEIISYLTLDTRDIKTKAHENILHTIACKAAIKAGSYTSSLERDKFIKRLMTTENIKYCPHGRPVITEISKKEIEKMFKRIQ
ncbi:MAG: DNA mismatch repair endonuclease MutL [Clostridia bacterium]